MATSDSRKVALVTGGALRVGRSISQCLHREGFNVFIHCNRSTKEATQLTEEFNRSRPNSAQFTSCDLSDDVEVTCTTLVETCVSQWGRLDALVNNASCFVVKSLLETTSAEWDTIMNTNLKAPSFLMKAASKYLKETCGSIVNISDLIGERPLPSHFAHSVSKAGLTCATETAALFLAPEIRVNAIAPGCVLWPAIERENVYNDQAKEAMMNATPLKRNGTPEDVAEAVIFLGSSKSNFITGVTLRIDGGIGLVPQNV